MRKGIYILGLLWLAMVSASFYVSFEKAKHSQQVFAFQTARSYFDQIQTTREWNARHGGVYVPITDETRPNPYLEVQGREIIVNDNLRLTKINPAFMTRQISEIASSRKEIQFHITSLKPIRPENRPTQKEEAALTAFETGKADSALYSAKEQGRNAIVVFDPLHRKDFNKTIGLGGPVSGHRNST